MPAILRPIRASIPALMVGALLAAAASVAGCVRYTIVSDGTTRAAIGETAAIGALKIRPLEVLEDSRCPAGAQCVWAGRVRLRAEVIDADSAVERVFAWPAEGAAADGGARLALVEISPDPEPSRKLYPEEYRFGFRPVNDLPTSPSSPRT